MGLSQNVEAAKKDFTEKEIALQRFLQNPVNLNETRTMLAKSSENSDEAIALKGWERIFSAHVIENEEVKCIWNFVFKSGTGAAT